MAREVLPVVKNTPVLAGVNGTDPFCDMDVFLDQLKALGFAGVQNFPTVGLIDGVFRANLEETGMSYALEVDMIAKARARDMLTTPYVFSEADAKAMAAAGADIVGPPPWSHDRWRDRRADRVETSGLSCAIDAWAERRWRSIPILVLAHGGPWSSRRTQRSS